MWSCCSRTSSFLVKSHRRGLANAFSASIRPLVCGSSSSNMRICQPDSTMTPRGPGPFSIQNHSFVTASKPTGKSSTAVGMNDHHRIPGAGPAIPEYLKDTYWWAYLHPKAIFVFERQWLVDLILWGNFNRLCNVALQNLTTPSSGKVQGGTLQVACVYGNLTPKLAELMDDTATLDVVDIAPIQIENLKTKLSSQSETARKLLEEQERIRVQQCNSANLMLFDSQSMNQVLLFFLLHEMPADVRQKTLKEACRVLKPGGKLVIVDYHMPTSWWHPHRYIMPCIWTALEPFAMDLMSREISQWIPSDVKGVKVVEKELFYGGLYQKVIVQKE